VSPQLWVVRIRLQTAEQQSSAVHTLPSILASNVFNFLTQEKLRTGLNLIFQDASLPKSTLGVNAKGPDIHTCLISEITDKKLQ